MNKKNIDIKKTLLDNGIIIVLLLLVLLTGITKDNFFSWNNLSNISVNTAARVIIAFGVSGCLITKGTDLSAGRMVGLASCIAGTLLQTADYSGKFFPNLGDMPVFGVLLLCIDLCHLWPDQRYRNRLPECTGFHRYPGHAAGCLWYLPGLYQRNTAWRLS